MKALSKMVEPCLRVPFVIVIDWYFEKLDLSNLGSVLRFSPGNVRSHVSICVNVHLIS